MQPEQRYFRKIIRIRADDSPNVRWALGEIAQGKTPSGRMVVPGVLSWDEYQMRRATWDKQRQTVGLDAEFYEGAEILLFPPEWLNRAEMLALGLRGKPRRAEAIGIDPAEGGDKTAMAAVDRFGLIDLISKKTPDTSIVTGEALAFMRRHQVPPEMVVFDRGGGGKEHADRLRAQGYNVRTVGFGESVSLDPKRGLTLMVDKLDNKEERYAYKNRRAEMYGTLSELMDPIGKGFALPREYAELRHQLSVMPKKYDEEGRIFLPPKNKREGQSIQCLVDMIGHSPDEADAVVLAVYGMMNKARRSTAGAV